MPVMKAYRSKRAQHHILETYDKLLSQWKINFTERKIETRYGIAHVIEWGCKTGKPLVLFHGVGDDSALMWIYNAAALGKCFHLFAIDTIGGPGKSTFTKEYNKDFDDVLWIDDILDGLQLSKTSVAGVSNGGYLVQLYTLYRKERVDKAMSLAASVPSEGMANPVKTMAKIFLPEALFPTKGNIKRLLVKLTGKHPEVFTDNSLIMEHYQWLLKGFSPMTMTYHTVRGFSDEEIDKIRDKVYYLVGKDDPFEKLGGAKALIDKKMNVKFYDGVGHGINHEIADTINNEIIKWCTSPSEALCE
jgi:pimeloyl-ACP methyl ester carboxylesterase